MEPFYYQHLEKSEQTIYHAIKTGLTALEDHFLGPYADPARISMIFFLVRLDCPEIFYAVTFKLRKWPQSDNLEILPEYLFDKKTIRQQQKAMSARVEKLARAVSTKTELEKELYIHDFICENIHYDNAPNAKRIAQNFNRLCNTLADTDTMTEWTDDLMRIWLFEFIVVYIFTDKIVNI